MAVDEARLRASLREVFARLDIDGSGAVSTREMRRMTDELGMEMSDEALVRARNDADAAGAADFVLSHAGQRAHRSQRVGGLSEHLGVGRGLFVVLATTSNSRITIHFSVHLNECSSTRNSAL